MRKLRPLIRKLLRQPERNRLQIATELFQSIEQQRINPEIDKAWRQEIRKRVSEMEAGKRKFIPWSAARERIRRKLRAAA